MAAAGAAEEAESALEAGASRTARAALGFEQLVSASTGDLERTVEPSSAATAATRAAR